MVSYICQTSLPEACVLSDGKISAACVFRMMSCIFSKLKDQQYLSSGKMMVRLTSELECSVSYLFSGLMAYTQKVYAHKIVLLVVDVFGCYWRWNGSWMQIRRASRI